MPFYINDESRCFTILKCETNAEALIYKNWIEENTPNRVISISAQMDFEFCEGETLVNYFGFTIETLVTSLFDIVPARSQSDKNQGLVIMLLKNPELSKNRCCIACDKEPTHYNRLIKALGTYCALISKLTGGRNPMKLLRGVRSDL